MLMMMVVVMVMLPVPHLQSTGTSGAKDGDLGLIYVNASNGLARAQGVRPGALLSNVGVRGG